MTTGHLDAARAVAVIVPGLGATLADAPDLVRKASRLAVRAGPGAVGVAWLGYDAPNVLQVVSDAKARSGAKELERFTAGVRATGLARQHVTVVGHSYGTLVAGIAARDALRADDLILLASPGVEAADATQLRLPPGHVWAARAATDPIQLVFLPAVLGRVVGLPVPRVFGPDPASPEFGARHFAVGGAYGHSGYFAEGSQSLDNLGRIVSGRPVRQ